MSGGSWNYMDQRGPTDNFRDTAQPFELREAAEALRGRFGDGAAAAILEEVAGLMEHAQKRFELVKPQLHALDWIDSGDISKGSYVPFVASSEVAT